MKFNQFLIEIIDLDKSMKGIDHPNAANWMFDVDGKKFKVGVVRMTTLVGETWYDGFEIVLFIWENSNWTSSHIKSNINAGIVGGKLISIIYNFISQTHPKVFTMRAYNTNLQRLYDTIWLKYGKTSPFSVYQRYRKDVDGISTYSFATGMNMVEDNYMAENYNEI